MYNTEKKSPKTDNNGLKLDKMEKVADKFTYAVAHKKTRMTKK